MSQTKPKKRGRPMKYTFHLMEVGETVHYDYPVGWEKRIARALEREREQGKDFITQGIGGSIVVHRVK